MSYWPTKPPTGTPIDRARAATLGLTHLWALNESGGLVKDYLGEAHGVLAGGASLNASPLGTAARFNAAGQAVKCPSAWISGSFTLFWHGILYTSSAGGLLVKGSASGDNFGDCRLELATLSGSTRMLQFFVFNDSQDGDGDNNGNVAINSGSAAPTGIPLIVVGTYDATTALMSLYQNGVRIASGVGGTNVDSSPGNLNNSTSLINHGAFPGGESTTSVNCVEFLAGIASRAWSPPQVAAFDPFSLFRSPRTRRALLAPALAGAPFLMDCEMTGFGHQMGL